MQIAQTNQNEMERQPCIGQERGTNCGRDGFHRVPKFSRFKIGDAVEGVPTANRCSPRARVMKTCCAIAALVAVMVGARSDIFRHISFGGNL